MSFEKPYQFFLRAIILLGIVGAFIPREAFDIQMHDTYFVIASWHTILVLCLFFGITMGCYWIVKNRKLIRWMTLFHLIATLVFLLCFIVFGYTSDNYITLDIHFLDSSIDQRIFAWSVLIWLFSQFIFILNVVISIFRKNQ